MTRAKFKCVSVTKRESNTWTPEGKIGPNGFVYDTLMYPVMDDTPENKQFFASTPTGTITIGTIRDDLFILGKEYYVDFSEV